MSWGAVAISAGSLISSYIASENQKDAASDAAYAQTNASNQANDVQLKMWEQASQDLAPYLNAGRTGLTQLQTTLPNYINQRIIPAANAYASFQPQALPSANFTVNPVTGQVQSYGSQAGPTQTQPVQQQPVQQNLSPQQATYDAARVNNALKSAYQKAVDAGGSASMITDIDTFLSSSKVPEVSKTAVRNALASKPAGSILQTGGNNGMQYFYAVPSTAANANISRSEPARIAPSNISTGSTAQQAMPSVVSQADLASGGVLSPNVPDFMRTLNPEDARFQADIPAPSLDVNDPYYQTRLGQKNEEINAFLAKNGLMNSTAGNTIRQRLLDEFNAGELDRQYNMSLSQYGLKNQAAQDLYGRELTERNYATQADIDKYNLLSSRGDTLYNRIYGQQGDLYNRLLGNTMATNEQNLATVARPYGVAQDIYNTENSLWSNLANIGSNAAARTGQQAIQTGQSVANNLLSSGNANAQAALASGQAQAGLWNTIGQLPATYMAAQNYMPQTSTYYNPAQMQGMSSNMLAANQSNTTGLNYW